jgi:hypothetical protein
MTTVSINPPKTPVTEGSNGIAAATVPNVCKMPGPPAPFVPTPLPNIGKSGDSPKGYSKTVKIEGNAVAIRGASFGSQGDIASKGTGGGLVSSNTHGPTKFIGPGSMNVQFEGKNVQLLGDPMLNNCGPSGSPANSATLAGVLQQLSAAATAPERPTTACASGNPHHTWVVTPAPGTKPIADKVRDAKAHPKFGTQFEGAAADHNQRAGDLTRSNQLSEGPEKIWWKCSVCSFQGREGDQLHDNPTGGNPIAVEAKSKTKLSESDAIQLGRNCQAVVQGGSSGLIYKVPAGPRHNMLVNRIRTIGQNQYGIAVKIVRV